MLRGKEIQAIAAGQKVRDTQIEKDYVITWLLWGGVPKPAPFKKLSFQRRDGTKKVWFPDYRFSEDLDFTLIEAEKSDKALLGEFQEAASLIESVSAIQLELGEIEKHQSGSIAFYISFVGPFGGRMGDKSVKIDITRGEKLFFVPAELPVFSAYRDLEEQIFSLYCYPLEEIIIEKNGSPNWENTASRPI